MHAKRMFHQRAKRKLEITEKRKAPNVVLLQSVWSCASVSVCVFGRGVTCQYTFKPSFRTSVCNCISLSKYVILLKYLMTHLSLTLQEHVLCVRVQVCLQVTRGPMHKTSSHNAVCLKWCTTNNHPVVVLSRVDADSLRQVHFKDWKPGPTQSPG